MEAKKNKKARLEDKRTSLLVLGFVCATSLTLMSFEYANFNLKNNKDLSGLNEKSEELWEMPDPVIEVVKPNVTQKTFNKEIIVPSPDPEPIIAPDPNPNPNPNPTPGPIIDPIPGPPAGGLPDPGPTLETNEPYIIVEEMPEFPGGIEEMYKFLSDNIVYPQLCKENGVQGKTYVQFTIEKDGSITDIEVMKSKHKLFSAESERVIKKMPKWKPGKQLNKPVRVKYTLPINYVLD